MSPGLPRSQAASAAQRTFLQLFGGNVSPLITVSYRFCRHQPCRRACPASYKTDSADTLIEVFLTA